MRILILATDIYTRGGVARYTATLAEALSRLPASVDVLPLLGDAGADADAQDARCHHDLGASFQRRVILAQAGIQAGKAFEVDSRFRGNDGEHCGNDDDGGSDNYGRSDCATEPGYRILTQTAARVTATAKIRHALRAFRQARRRYDLVICSHLGQAPIAALIRLRYGTPYLVAAHGSEAWGRLPAIKRLAVRRAGAVLAVSAYTARTMARANGIASARVKVVYNAIPDELVRALASGDSSLLSEAHHPLFPSSERRGVPIFQLPSWDQEGPGVVDSTKHHPLFSSSERRGDPNSPRPMLLSVASLKREHAYKGVDTVIEALPRILATVPEARYVVAGAGEDRARLERIASDLGVRDRVTFAGGVSDDELASLYRACDVFMLPSRTSRTLSNQSPILSFRGAAGDEESRLSRVFRSKFLARFILSSFAALRTVRSGGANGLGMTRFGNVFQQTVRDDERSEGTAQGEGFGRVYVEAALAGKPVVGSVDGGAAEAVIDGRTGLLVDPRSVEQVAGAVIRLLESPDRAASLGAEGRRWALERFTVAAMRKSLEAVISSVVLSPASVVRGPLSVVPCASSCVVRSTAVGLPPLTTDNGQLTTDH